MIDNKPQHGEQNMTTLTEKEAKAIKQIATEGLDDMGGSEPKDLHDDNMSWFNRSTISAAGFSKHEAAGLMSSLEEKGLIQNFDPSHRYGWALTDEGIDAAQEIW